MSQTIYKAVLVVVGNPVVLGFQDTLRARSGLVSDAAISKAEEAISKSNKETKAAWAKLSHKDSDEGSIRLLFETEGLGSAEVELIRVALEKGLDSSWRLQKLSKAMDHSVALFKCCDYDHDPKAMADKIPQFIKDNPIAMRYNNFLASPTSFAKYIQGYTNLTMPLTVLLMKNTPFDWDTACENAFAGLKTALTSAPCLALPDTSEGSLIFDLVCDISGFGLCAVLIQQGRPIACWSRKMVLAEQNYHITEQELLAVIEALKAFRCYVDGIPFDLVTDHKPNIFLGTQPMLSRDQTRWSEYLQRFNFTWEYRPGRTNVADPLSCDPAYRPATSLVAHALRAQLCVTTHSKTTPTPVTPEPAMLTQDGP